MSPTAPIGFCSVPGCSARARGRCPAHQAPVRQQQRRHYTGIPGVHYGRRWRAARDRFLAAHPFCIDCQAEGNPLGLANEVDHDPPHHGNYEAFHDVSTWRPRCKSHHSRKTAREVGFGQR
jgi:5-methylcytosine-specific restriction protein A